MPYASGRVIHDADAHIMEVPGFLADHLEAKYRDVITDDVLFPRRDGFHSRLDEAERAGRARRSTRRRSCWPRTGTRSARGASRTGRARSTCWASPAS